MKRLPCSFLFVSLFLSCTGLPAEKGFLNQTETPPAEDAATLQKLSGEWVKLNYNWEDSLLLFRNLADTSFHPQALPSYDVFTFNTQSHEIETQIYGEAGCGLGAIQNKPESSGCQLAGKQLHLRFSYNNNEGDHLVDRNYNVERRGDTLHLVWQP